MNILKSTTLAIAIVFSSISLVYCLPSAIAQDDETMGWLEGTVKDVDGNPLHFWHVKLYKKNGRQSHDTYSEGGQGGFFSLRDIKPGVYEVRVVTADSVSERSKELRQQRIWGVAIKKGVRSVLDVKLNEGKSRDFEEIGEPSVQTLNVMKLTEEIDQLKAQIEDLKK